MSEFVSYSETSPSPANMLNDFMLTTQSLGRAIHDNIRLCGPLFGEQWAKNQAELLSQAAAENCQLVAKVLSDLETQNLLPLVEADGAIGRLLGVGTDEVNEYQLAAHIGGQRRELSLGRAALIDNTDTTGLVLPTSTPLSPRRQRPTMAFHCPLPKTPTSSAGLSSNERT